jgi:hypothetical protein
MNYFIIPFSFSIIQSISCPNKYHLKILNFDLSIQYSSNKIYLENSLAIVLWGAEPKTIDYSSNYLKCVAQYRSARTKYYPHVVQYLSDLQHSIRDAIKYLPSSAKYLIVRPVLTRKRLSPVRTGTKYPGEETKYPRAGSVLTRKR